MSAVQLMNCLLVRFNPVITLYSCRRSPGRLALKHRLILSNEAHRMIPTSKCSQIFQQKGRDAQLYSVPFFGTRKELQESLVEL